MYQLFILGVAFLILYGLIQWFSSTKDVPSKRTIDRVYSNKLFDKIDKLTEGMGDHKPDKIIVGNHYWKMIPSHITWKPEMEVINGSAVIKKFGEADSISYKGIEVVHDKKHEYTFDLE